MKHLLIFILLVTLLGCNDSKTKKTLIERNANWSMHFNVWGAPWDSSFNVNLENAKDSIIVIQSKLVQTANGGRIKNFIEKRRASKLSRSDKDSIYTMTLAVFNNLAFPKSSRAEFADGVNASIGIEQNLVALICNFYRLNKIENASPEVGRLINFINKRLTDADKIN
jgi:hypothetical protein